MMDTIAKMNLGEASRYFKGRSIKRVLFSSQNQTWENAAYPLKVNTSFSEMLFFVGDTDSIYLKEEENSIGFGQVKYVTVDETVSLLGTVMKVACGDTPEIIYTLIIQWKS